ncbi:MAG: RluA family pseudouridine synthase [Verrucomicrobia bacterium]|nr:RluA family pseudouridine synthase [Verrucomicrobiota bacterium]
MQTDEITISSEEMCVRLDKFLAQAYPLHSRTYFQYLIDRGLVLVNGDVWKKKDIPRLGDTVEVCFELTPELNLTPENIPLDILYEDEFLLAVNKPPGMVVHPAPGHPQGTFVNALLYHCQSLPDMESLRPGIVHRLDKDTSGVLLAAKTLASHQQLIDLFASRQMEKTYQAICVGTPRDGVIDAPIGRHPTRRQEMAVREGGKVALSDVKCLKTRGDLSFVEIRPKTGRTHQIRVHLAHIAAPVLGDPVYGRPAMNEKWDVQQQLLHASQLRFTHPMTGKFLEIIAPLHGRFTKFLEYLDQ